MIVNHHFPYNYLNMAYFLTAEYMSLMLRAQIEFTCLHHSKTKSLYKCCMSAAFYTVVCLNLHVEVTLYDLGIWHC